MNQGINYFIIYRYKWSCGQKLVSNVIIIINRAKTAKGTVGKQMNFSDGYIGLCSL